MIKYLLIFFLSSIAFVSKAQETVTIPLPLEGKFYINQDSYKNGSEETACNAEFFKFANGNLNDRVYLNEDVTGKNLMFETVSADAYVLGMSGEGIFDFSGKCVWNKRFIIYRGTYLFTGDRLEFSSSPSKAIAMGQGRDEDCNVTLNLNYIDLNTEKIETAYSSYTYKLSVSLSKGVISNGAIDVNATQTGDIIVGAASITSELIGNVINSEGNPAYQIKLPHNNDLEFTVKKDDGSGSYKDFQNYSFTCFHKDDEGNDDPAYYLYLPDGDYSVTTGTETYTFTVKGEAVNLTLKPIIAGEGIIDLSGGEFSWIDGGYQVGNQPYTYDGTNGYTFTGTTANPLVIPNVFPAETITLKDLTIDRTNEITDDKAITIEKTGDFKIILDGNSNLKGNSNDNGNIEYTGSGTLSISGTLADNSDTLSLSRHSTADATKLNVKSGTVLNSGGSISSGGSFVIDGGVVSCFYINSTIIVNGGTFKKYSDNTSENYTSAGAIGNITINGGTSYIQLWNAENPGLDANVKINGGSVCIENPCNATSGNFDGTYRFAAAGSPTRTDGTDIVYQSIFKLPVPVNTKIDAITVDGEVYPSNDVFTDAESSVYLWLPETVDIGENPVTNISIFIDGTEFKLGGFVDTQFEYEPYVDAMNPGQGNKQELISLVSTATTNGSFAFSGDYAVEYNSNWYACSCSDVNITATPDANCQLECITVNGTALANGKTSFSVVRPDQTVTQMEVSVNFTSVSTAVDENDASKEKVFTVDNAINIQGADRAKVQVISVSGVKVYEAQNVSSDYITLKPGMYIVVVDNSTYKVVVK